MIRSHHPVRRFTTILVLFGLIIIAAAFLRAKRTQATERARLYEPTIHQSLLIPAGTQLAALVKSGIPSSFGVGDTVTALVSKPLLVNGRIAIPVNSPVKGTIEAITTSGTNARVQAHFTEIDMTAGPLFIQTDSVIINTRVQRDADVLRNAVSMLMGATLGAATQAYSKDPRLVESGLFEGVNKSVAAPQPSAFHVVLLAPLQVQN